MLAAVFPSIPPHLRKRKAISSRLNRVRLLRNRAFHHEPIWHWRDLREQYDAIRELLQWISPPLNSTITLNDRFPDVLAGGRRAFRDGVARVKRMTDGEREIAVVPALSPAA